MWWVWFQNSLQLKPTLIYYFFELNGGLPVFVYDFRYLEASVLRIFLWWEYLKPLLARYALWNLSSFAWSAVEDIRFNVGTGIRVVVFKMWPEQRAIKSSGRTLLKRFSDKEWYSMHCAIGNFTMGQWGKAVGHKNNEVNYLRKLRDGWICISWS